MTSPDRRAVLERLLSQRILILDGALGTMVQARELGEADFRGERFADHPSELAGDNELLVLTKPTLVQEIHDEFLAAGADIIETNTFGANTVAQSDYGLEELAYEMNVRAAEIAVECTTRW